MQPVDITVDPTITDRAKSQRVDTPGGANALRVEPVIESKDWDKGLSVDVVARVLWPDGTSETGRARLDMGYRSHPAATFQFSRPLDGAQVEAEAVPVGAPLKLGVRLTCGEADKLPAKRERPTKLDGEPK